MGDSSETDTVSRRLFSEEQPAASGSVYIYETVKGEGWDGEISSTEKEREPRSRDV